MKKSLLVFIFLLISVNFYASQISREQIIAAYLFNFSKNMSWPDEGSMNSFEILVVDDVTDFSRELKSILEDRKTKGVPIKVSIKNSAKDFSSYHFVFLPKHNARLFDSVIKAIEGEKSILVSEGVFHFEELMINLVADEQGSLSFEINKPNIQKQKVEVLPEIVLLGGSKDDVRLMFNEFKLKLDIAQNELSEQTNLVKIRDREMLEQQKTIELRQNEIDSLQKEFLLTESKLNLVNQQIEINEEILEEKYAIIEQQETELRIQQKQLRLKEKELDAYLRKITESEKRLNRLSDNILQKQKRIEDLNVSLDQQVELTDTQKRFSNLLGFFILLLAAFVILAVRAYLLNKRTSNLLEKRVAERTSELNLSNVQLKTEIEKRKKKEAELIESKNRVQQLFENSPIAILEEDLSYVHRMTSHLKFSAKEELRVYLEQHPELIEDLSKHFVIIDANKEAIQFYKANSLLELKNQYSEKYFPVKREGFIEELYAIIMNETELEQETILKNFAGEERNVILRWILLPDFKDYSRVLVSIKDVTPLKQAEILLMQYQHHLEELVNERTAEIEKINAELKGANVLLISKNDELELANMKLLEKQKEVEILNQSLKQSNNELNKINGLLLEQKEELETALQSLKDAQNQLIQSEKMASIGTLTAGVAHEINNPVNYINSGLAGFNKSLNNILAVFHEIRQELNLAKNEKLAQKIEEIERKKELDFNIQALKKMTNNIQEGTRRTVEIVKSLRHLTGSNELSDQHMDLHEGLESALIMLYHTYKNRIEIKKDFQSIPNLRCKPGKINQVFMNVLSNAIQAIEGKGFITISTRYNEEENQLIIRVEDSGKGISQEIIDKIFDPFFSTKNVGEGTGLGLYISYSIVKEHNGDISFESSKGKGTVCYLRFPINHSNN